MFRFFQKLREKLLKQGRLSRYLLYAVGEIFLVVLGILIALQINNWNENRKSRVVTMTYLENIRNDVLADTLSLSLILEEANQIERGIGNYFHFFDEKNWEVNDLVDSALHTPRAYFRYLPTNSTYTDMLSAGNSKLLGEDVRRSLSDLKILQDHLSIISDRIITDTKNSIYENKKFWDFDLERNFFETLEVKPEKKDLVQGLLHFHNTLKHTKDGAGQIRSGVGLQIRNKSKGVIHLIDEDLKK